MTRPHDKIGHDKTGQFFSIDIIIAFLAFILIIFVASAARDYGQEKHTTAEWRNDLEITSKGSLAVLIETPGNPPDWETFPNSTGIISLGLAGGTMDISGLTAEPYGYLDSQKIASLQNLFAAEPVRTTALLGLPGDQFLLLIRQWNGSDYQLTSSIGNEPSTSAAFIVQQDRYALLNNNITQIRMVVWKECEGVMCR
ncbi:hypothetical protein J4460_06670 [Candidatus Woesearchaeota archaeon]|nr:MAG: hypothetical protein QS99_C0017G0006 [archaeon GW2011_AR4]MBS3130323.1 hypothetical protein [Candidatus Woesearchaeota archaeon]HIH38956.1 hypothetical protein [Candidatus Woesearchaeota archaeon]HIH48074.1 hypothetical protein [Candidatus Woesearchaeota archaeon]HIJ03417.1 hypothetical protein [Candidatus Woesearchaeota archaeon]